jgi:hypothetical protein
MSAPDEIVVDGLRYRRVDRHANRVSVHVMYDCHLFRKLEGASVQALIEDWQHECEKPEPDLGEPFLCPAIVLDGDKELRRVGSMVFPGAPDTTKKLEEWRTLVSRDPDIPRILAHALSADTNG